MFLNCNVTHEFNHDVLSHADNPTQTKGIKKSAISNFFSETMQRSVGKEGETEKDKAGEEGLIFIIKKIINR